MGASSWTARAGYQEGLEAALQLAREDAYKRGAFYRTDVDVEARTMTEEQYVAQQMAWARDTLPDEIRDEGWEPDDSFAREDWRAAQIEVTGPDTLLASQPSSGTHSVIDMTGVATAPADGMVAPLPDHVLDSIFGTRRPSVAAVEAAISRDAIDDFGRDRGVHLIAYEGATPAYVYFLGYSGD